ncbi:MAG: GNAT family N-acetyltransferase [Pseudomonadota bacterium]
MKHDTMVAQPVIETERMVLRPLRKSDAGLLQMYAGDERVARNTSSIPHPMAPGTTEAFISRTHAENRTEDVWAMDGTKSGLGEVMGVISLTAMDREQSEIGYWVAPVFWNTGLATEAVQAMLVSNPQGAKTIFAAVFQDNPASARILTNLGFGYIGDAESYSVARGATVPTWTYIRTQG